MNIQTVIANLLDTIQVKEQLLKSFRNRSDLASETMAAVIELNIKELNNILADCMAVREADIVKDLEMKELQRQNSVYGWMVNPDRSGGQFTQDEINNKDWYH